MANSRTGYSPKRRTHILTLNGGSSGIVGKPLERGLYRTFARTGLGGTNLTFHELGSKQPESCQLAASSLSRPISKSCLPMCCF
jgi:hypothetical protein